MRIDMLKFDKFSIQQDKGDASRLTKKLVEAYETLLKIENERQELTALLEDKSLIEICCKQKVAPLLTNVKDVIQDLQKTVEMKKKTSFEFLQCILDVVRTVVSVTEDLRLEIEKLKDVIKMQSKTSQQQIHSPEMIFTNGCNTKEDINEQHENEMNCLNSTISNVETVFTNTTSVFKSCMEVSETPSDANEEEQEMDSFTDEENTSSANLEFEDFCSQILSQSTNSTISEEDNASNERVQNSDHEIKIPSHLQLAIANIPSYIFANNTVSIINSRAHTHGHPSSSQSVTHRHYEDSSDEDDV